MVEEGGVVWFAGRRRNIGKREAKHQTAMVEGNIGPVLVDRKPVLVIP